MQRNIFKNVMALAIVAVVSLGSLSTSQAVTISTAATATVIVSSPSELAPFTVSSTDIGETNGTWSLVSGAANFGSNVTELNDGDKYGTQNTNVTTHSFTPSNGAIAILTLDGQFDISSIVSLTGTGQSRAGQAYTVDVSSDGSIFSFLHTVGGEPNNLDSGARETQVTISDSISSTLATNVKALRFTFQNCCAGSSVDQSMYREIDVFVSTGGGGGVPEPATATLAMLGLGGLLMRRKRTA